MATTAGLQTHIWNNNLKSMALLAVYPLILTGIVWASAVAVSYTSMSGGDMDQAQAFAGNVIYDYWPMIFATCGIWFTVAYFFHTKMVRSLAHSHPVTRAEEPELYNLLENLCIAEGVPMPRLEIIETHARNAFASGIDQKSFAVTVTRGLMQSLKKDELEAVLAHELAHIQNRDVRLLIITIIFTGMIGFAAQFVWSNIRYAIWVPRHRSGGKNGGNAFLILIVIAVILWIGYMATLFTRFALSRRREYMADAGAVQMTKNPEAMMRALMRIAGMERVPKLTDDIAMMCIENSKPFMGLFATHPPIQKRIEAISQTTGASVPDILPKSRASGDERFLHPSIQRNNWITRKRAFRRTGNPWAR